VNTGLFENTRRFSVLREFLPFEELKETMFFSHLPTIEREIDEGRYHAIYEQWKSTQTPYRQWILHYLENGATANDIHDRLDEVRSFKGMRQNITLLSIRTEVSRILREIRELVRSLDDSSNDLER